MDQKKKNVFSFLRLIYGLLGLSLTLALASGCTPQSQSAQASDSRLAPLSFSGAGDTGKAGSGAATIIPLAAYQRARSLYAHRDYAAALASINALLAEPQRSEAERTFLLRQKQICEQSLRTGKPEVPAAASVTATVTASTILSTLPVRKAAPIDTVDCGPRSLLLICQQERIPHEHANLAALERAAGTDAAKGGTSLEGLANAAKSVGFTAQGVQMDKDALSNLKSPALAWVEGNHYIAVLGINRSLLGEEHDTARIHDPNHNGEEVIPLKELLSRSGGVLLTLTPTRNSST